MESIGELLENTGNDTEVDHSGHAGHVMNHAGHEMNHAGHEMNHAGHVMSPASQDIDHSGHQGHGTNHDNTKDLAHDHSEGHGDHGAGHTMTMWFHGGCEEVVLFSWWKISSASGMVLSCVLLFLAAIAYEGLKIFRERLKSQDAGCQCDAKLQNGSAGHGGAAAVNSGCGCKEMSLLRDETSGLSGRSDADVLVTPTSGVVVGAAKACCGSKYGRRYCRCHFTLLHLVQTLLHMFQLFWSYCLMLVFMTYNGWLCLAVVLGAGVGYLLFAWMRTSSPADDDHCNS